jgi:clan AA aspartic protease (TIGR02281 family)
MKFLFYLFIFFLILGFSIFFNFHNYTEKSNKNYATNNEVFDAKKNSNIIPKYERQNKHNFELKSVDLEKLFEIGEYRDLAILWQELEYLDYVEAQTIKRDWLEKSYTWLKKENLIPLKSFIDSWLNYSSEDYDFLFFQAQVDLFFGDRIKALNDSFFLLERLPENNKNFHKDRFASNIQKLIIQMESNELWNDLIVFIDQLLWHSPNETKYTLKLAEAHYQAGNYKFSKNILSSIEYETRFSRDINFLKAKINNKNTKNTEISLKKYNSHYIVSGDLNNIKVNLLVDTGATISVITKKFFERNKSSFNAKFIKKSFVNTAGGKIEAKVYLFPTFSIKDYSLQNIEFLVIDSLEDERIDGLLGMNFLKEFKFQIDQDDGVLKLRYR